MCYYLWLQHIPVAVPRYFNFTVKSPEPTPLAVWELRWGLRLTTCCNAPHCVHCGVHA
eukprot:COSAG01_NODE_20172_length_967_cov_0.918203_1_plen_57_part_10